MSDLIQMSANSAQVSWGLFNRRERWGLSLGGWTVAIALVAVATATVGITIYPFLAPTERVAAKVLVVEGWVPPYAIRAAASEFARGHYDWVVATGGPVEGLGGYTDVAGTAASLGATRLRQAGVPPECVALAPSRVSDRDRTYHGAVALGRWLARHQPQVTRINVLTADVHARRTRLLYQRALGARFTVGVIAVPSPDYNPRRWWRYSEGVRSVLGESIAYVYARVFFHPRPESEQIAHETSAAASPQPE